MSTRLRAPGSPLRERTVDPVVDPLLPELTLAPAAPEPPVEATVPEVAPPAEPAVPEPPDEAPG